MSTVKGLYEICTIDAKYFGCRQESNTDVLMTTISFSHKSKLNVICTYLSFPTFYAFITFDFIFKISIFIFQWKRR